MTSSFPLPIWAVEIPPKGFNQSSSNYRADTEQRHSLPSKGVFLGESFFAGKLVLLWLWSHLGDPRHNLIGEVYVGLVEFERQSKFWIVTLMEN